ncbi:MAG: aspartate/glutamate racemase family protein [Acidobacteriota bacterium]
MLLVAVILAASAVVPAASPDIVDTILTDEDSFYYLDAKTYPRGDASLPIGVFDSGTGGLTVLREVVDCDRFDNATRAPRPGGDGRRDFESESFVYFGDQANMPYGTYPEEGNTALLVEHVIKDVQFLLGTRYYRSGTTGPFRGDKRPVKAIVIACNTATAYGIEEIRKFLLRAGLLLKVIGVVEAGAAGALDTLAGDQDATVGVLATLGTVQSQAYPRAIEALAAGRGGKGRLSVVQQGGISLAGAIDGLKEFVDPDARAPRPGYRGPSPDPALLSRYGFDWEKVLHEGPRGAPRNVQLNSVENHVAYETLSLVERVRRTPGARPLSTVILGCTHYPFVADLFRKHLARLYDYTENGEHVYRPFLAREVTLVDPAVITATQLHEFLVANRLLAGGPAAGSEFYVSVPNRADPSVEVDASGAFTYRYKYGRKPGTGQETVRVVPFSRRTIPADTLTRLRATTPSVWEMIVRFNAASPKLSDLPGDERIR